MLLSTCFLFFILWFCCFTLAKQKKVSAQSNKLKQCLIETELNLNKLGMTTIKRGDESNKVGATPIRNSSIKVRDAAPTTISSSPLSSSTTVELPITIDNGTTASTSRMFHPYDSLHLKEVNESVGRNKKISQALNQQTQIDRSKKPGSSREANRHARRTITSSTSVGNINQAFSSDYECFFTVERPNRWLKDTLKNIYF